MSIGTSGRVVVEIDPELKRSLHALLARKGMTLKEWFVSQADRSIASDPDSTSRKPSKGQRRGVANGR